MSQLKSVWRNCDQSSHFSCPFLLDFVHERPLRIVFCPKSNPLVAPIYNLLQKTMGESLKELQAEVDNVIPKDQQLSQQDLETIRNIFEYFRTNKLLTWRGFKRWIEENRILFSFFSCGDNIGDDEISISQPSLIEDPGAKVKPSSSEEVLEPPPPEVLKITKEEFNTVLDCCKWVNLSPRTLKRLINVYKLFKIVWFRSNTSKDAREESKIRKTIVLFLALSGRYLSLMRDVFEALERGYEEEQQLDKNLIDFFLEKIVILPFISGFS